MCGEGCSHILFIYEFSKYVRTRYGITLLAAAIYCFCEHLINDVQYIYMCEQTSVLLWFLLLSLQYYYHDDSYVHGRYYNNNYHSLVCDYQRSKYPYSIINNNHKELAYSCQGHYKSFCWQSNDDNAIAFMNTSLCRPHHCMRGALTTVR